MHLAAQMHLLNGSRIGVIFLKANSPDSKMILGTVQLGMQYGRIHSQSRPKLDEAYKILDWSIRHGINEIDTARVYGESETIIGNYVEKTNSYPTIYSKIAPLRDFEKKSLKLSLDSITKSVKQSLLELKNYSIQTMMAHKLEDLMAHDWRILEHLLMLASEGHFKEVGVSVQTPKEFEMALNRFEIKHIQFPINILDKRWGEALLRVRNNRDVRIHARSCFLQGLLLLDSAECWPKVPGVNPQKILNQLGRWVKDFRRESSSDLCIAFVRSLRLVDGMVLGVNSLEQLKNNINLFEKPLLTSSQMEEINFTIPLLPESLLNPALWRD
jgi:aryl-alcohol dehydrogenase-like predicted oxidoreductase